MSEIRNLINITDLTVEEIDRLIAVADDIVAHHSAYEDICAQEAGDAVLRTKHQNQIEL